MKKTKEKYAQPFSVRLTVEEKHWLEEQAGRMPVGEYIRFMLFEMPSPRRKTRKPPRNEEILRELLKTLAGTRIANNLNQLAKASNSGSLPVSGETEETLQSAYVEIQEMREIL